MKKERTTRAIGFDAQTASELAEMLNDFYQDHRGDKIEVTYCGQFGLSALLTWEEMTHTPETLREEYEIRGEAYTCADCQNRKPITDGRRRCQWYCNRRPRGTTLDSPACNNFYLELEGENG